jgi:HlyD family secretion protein
MAQLIDRPSSNGHSVFTVPEAPPPGTTRPPRFRRPSRWMVVAAVAAIVALVAGIVVWRLRSGAAPVYVTAPVTQGTLVQTATSSGTVNPQNTISVGTQVSGTLSQLFVDFNSKVKKGQVLAKLDPTTLEASLAQAQAALAQAQAQASAAGATAQGEVSNIAASQAQAAAQLATVQADQANIATAQSNVAKSQAALTLSQQTLTRDQTLLAQGFMAAATVDTDKSNVVAAQSALSAAQAALNQAKSQVLAQAAQARASTATAQQSQSTALSGAATAQANQAAVMAAQAQVQQAQLNLQHSIITSPVDGTVVARDVSVGQTVAASLQTPTLFSIAQDLGKMEVDLAVGENDIGNVKTGDNVDFSVLAYPGQTFHGTVSQVRVNPTTVSNVVTYDTVVLVNNKGGKLLPGMTANASIGVQEANNALIVPLAALTYRPANAGGARRRPQAASSSAPRAAASAPQGQGQAQQPAAANGSPWGQTLGASSASLVAGSRARLFVDKSGKLTPVPVSITLVNATSAAVTPLRGTLQPGDQVVVSDGLAQRRSPSGQAQRGPGGYGGVTRGLH